LSSLGAFFNLRSLLYLNPANAEEVKLLEEQADKKRFQQPARLFWLYNKCWGCNE
jgi:hypothetical protein